VALDGCRGAGGGWLHWLAVVAAPQAAETTERSMGAGCCGERGCS